jgi:signal transduction histidine kinase/DNA-binding response OmpR family regulator/HPt (histidine-containing phosphotransfer) domain-containing protein/HAMP domain-containing protein
MMKPENIKPRTLGITLRTALLSWLVTISTLLLFVLVIIPQQKRIFLENLESKAHGVAVSLHEVAAGAAVNEDYSSVVDHCKDMLAGDESLDYIVVTKNDGLSVRYDRISGWRMETDADNTWRPEKRAPVSGIGVVPLFNRRVFHYSQPFDYSGIQWGWIHVGLSLKSYDRNVAMVYQRTGLLAIGCIVLSLLASVLYAQRLVRPILRLRKVLQKVAGGDLSARAKIESSDELGNLASSVNSMTEALRQRDKILQSVRFAAQQFLNTSNWETVIPEVLATIGKAAAASRVCVFENHADESGALTSQRFVWNDNGVQSHATNPNLQNFSWSRTGLTHWAAQLQHGEFVAISSPSWTPPERAVLESLGICSMLLIPIRVENIWWGFLGLDDCNFARQWTEAERDSLRAAADMLGAAVSRQRTQDALLRAKEAAEAASLAKSQFLANMSHEIRTPITGVMGMLQLLQHTPLDEKQRRYVTNTLTSADALLTVIGDVLDFSKIEAGKLELKETVFSLPDTLDMAVGLLAEKVEVKKLEVACRVAPEVPRQLVGDPNRLRQVLLNLLSNAVKFTDHGTVLVSCAVAEIHDESTLLRFEVKDSGAGIAPEQQAQIFEAFCQADNSMSRAHGGTGLGLTICRQLVQLMDGQIGVQSVPGEGSTFWFTARFKNIADSGQAAAAPGLVDLRGLHVLVVDDCQVVREIICDYVRAWKGVPEEASEAATGLEKLRRAAAHGEPFAVAVIDWRMPGLDGFALARLLKEEPALSATGLVLLGSFTQMNMSAECQSAGFAAWLPKPARKSELYNAIIRAANNRSPRLPQLAAPTILPAGGPLEIKGSGNIILAEDNEINQEVASEMLAALGYHCVRARTGREAVALVQQGAADLVLMDCQMPEMDGYEATRLIRRWEQQSAPTAGRKPHLSIVALTAHAMIGDRSRCLEAGMDDYLTKPLEPGALAKMLSQWMPAAVIANTQTPDQPAEIGRTGGPPAGIDFPSLLHRCMGKQELAERLVKKLLIQAVTDVLELETAIREQDAGRVELVAHRIKGSAANVSADAVRECASRLELAGRKKNLVPAPKLLEQLRANLENIKIPTHLKPPR